jgi:hypothetical protein
MGQWAVHLSHLQAQCVIGNGTGIQPQSDNDESQVVELAREEVIQGCEYTSM